MDNTINTKEKISKKENNKTKKKLFLKKIKRSKTKQRLLIFAQY